MEMNKARRMMRMANRTYLYVMNENETRIGDASEYPYDLPLFYKILISQETELVESYLFETKELIAYKGSFSKGMETYYAFLKYLFSLPNIDNKQIISYIEETENFFISKRPGNWHKFLLEPGEYFDLLSDQSSLSDQSRIALKEIKGIACDIEEILQQENTDLFTRANKSYWIKELQEDITKIKPYWSHVCYFSFNSSLRD